MNRNLLCALLPVLVLTAAPSLRLTENGRSAYSIVIAQDSSPSERRAAAELQRFLEEISGARLPILPDSASVRGNLLLVGRSRLTSSLRFQIPFDQLGDEGFAIQSRGPHLAIAGGRLRGTMYGVYTFLEKLGCRWVAADASRIPKRRTITLAPIDETQKPAFEYREVYLSEAFDQDWAARNKTNGMSTRLDESTGGKIQYYPFVHTFYSILPPAEHFAQHPEYYSLIDGKRRGAQAQLCLTNPDVLRLTVAKVRQWMNEHPEATIFSVSQNDYYGQCECDHCRRVTREEGGAESGPLLRFVNAVADQVALTHPGKLIDTLAYFYSEAPPSLTRPRPNVRVRMCPIGACNAHPYEQCPHNAYIVKNLKAWAKITSNIYVWHYNANFSHYLLPVPDFDELAADIPMYYRNGVAGLFMQGSTPAGGSEAPLRAYVIARMLWDPRTDFWKTVDEFHEIYYGSAAPSMRAYLDLLHSLVRPQPQGEAQHWWCCRAPRMGDTRLNQAKQLIKTALAQATDDTTRRRIRQAELSLRYLELRQLQSFTIRDGWYAPTGLDRLKTEWPAFIADAKALGVTRLSEEAELAKDDANFTATLRAYRVVTLESSTLRLHLVPELNARVVHILDKRSGRELLNQPAAEETSYPNRTGLSASVYPDFVNAPAYTVHWTAELSEDKHEAILTGITPQGLTLRRTIRLAPSEPGIHTETIAGNASAQPLDAVIQSQFDSDAGPMQDALVEFQPAAGPAVRRRMIEPAQQPTGTETYAAERNPNGEWRVLNPGAKLTLINRFPPEQTDRGVLNWSAKSQRRVVLGLWSKKRLLQPGETVRLVSDYALR
ncbi:MAG: DUF4838 domain-containing protein [Bryobacterales bacterium]|nr:DUF4838 domain-containing protein [Bryobacterales bacterium]